MANDEGKRDLVDPLDQLDSALSSSFNRHQGVDQVPEGWLTCKQWAEKEGKSRPWAGERIAVLVKAGEWEMRKFRVHTGLKVCSLPHYRPKP